MSETTPASSSGMRLEAARERISAFSELGPAHHYFAQHAAFPMSLTVDLLYRLWANFQRDVHDEKLHIPWIAVADLLFSSLCDEVGHELYEMDVTVRSELLSDMQADFRFGQQRMHELSYFLLDYVQQQLHSSNVGVRKFAEAQQWTVLAYIQPGRAARELAEALKALEQNNRVEQIRLVSLMETLNKLAPPLSNLEGFTPLLTYARGVERIARGDIEGAKAQFGAIKEVEQAVGVQLPLPAGLGEARQEVVSPQQVPSTPPTPVTSETPPTRKDLLISYHSADADWANWIAWQLEGAGYIIELEVWAFQPQANFTTEVDRVEKLAKHIIVILSPDYLNALASMPAWVDAFLRDPRNGPDFIVALHVRECRTTLASILGTVDYTNLVGLDEEAVGEALLNRLSRLPDAPLLPSSMSYHSLTVQPLFPGTPQGTGVQQIEEGDADASKGVAGATLLWVDDHPENNIYESREMEALGIQITLSLSTEDALEKVRERSYDVIISDMGRQPPAPKTSYDHRAGYALLDKLRDQHISTPFIIYAGSSSAEHQAETKRHGGFGTTNDPEVLLQMVIGAIKQSPSGPATETETVTEEVAEGTEDIVKGTLKEEREDIVEGVGKGVKGVLESEVIEDVGRADEGALRRTEGVVEGVEDKPKGLFSRVAEGVRRVVGQLGSISGSSVRQETEVPWIEEGDAHANKGIDEDDAHTDKGIAGANLLWVDDHPENNIYPRRAMEAVGIRITLSKSTEDALEKVHSHIYDVIISDMGRQPPNPQAPYDRRAGYTLLDKLRDQHIFTPFIIYAGSSSAEHQAATKRHGGFGTTTDPEVLFQMVIDAIKQSINPSSTETEASQQTKGQWEEEGDAHVNSGRYAEALEAYNHVLEIDPSHADVYNNRGIVYYQLGQYQQALADYSHAIELDPDHAAYSNRGLVYFQLREYQQALADYAHAIALKPDDSVTYIRWGDALYSLQNFAEALEKYEQAISLGLTNPRSYVGRGKTLAALGRYEEALTSIEQATNLDPTYADAYYQKSNLFYTLRRYQEALLACDRAITLKPDVSMYYQGKGNILYLLKRYEEALAAYNHAIELNKDFALAYFNRGAVYYELRNYELAISSYEAALRFYTQTAFPAEWANSQARLGDAYYMRAEGNRQDNAERAIACYQAALQVYTRAVFPTEWAELQQKLGDASRAYERSRMLTANLDQLIETVKSQMQPPPRAMATASTLQQLSNFIPNEVTLADLVVGWQALSHSSEEEEESAVSQRRVTCGELANMASQFTTDQGNLAQAIKTWQYWLDAFKNSGDPRQSAMARTFERELVELRKVIH